MNWGPIQLEGAFGGAYRRYRIDGPPGMDPATFSSRIRGFLVDLLRQEMRTGVVHSQAFTWIRFRKDREVVELAFNSRMLNVYNLSNKNELVTAMITHMAQQIKNPALSDSKFVFDEVISTTVDFHRSNLTRGSSYLPLPDWLARKKAIINPQNKDLECFKWAVIAATRWEDTGKNPERITKLKKFESDYNWTGIRYPVFIKDIAGFESGNQISINILAVEDKQIYIRRKGAKYNRIVNLLLITENNHKHYVAIKSLSRLLTSKNTKHREKQYYCMNCLQGFMEEHSRDEHVEYYKNNEAVRIEIPTRKPFIKYSHRQFQFKVPFIMYVDFESILEPIKGPLNNPRLSSTKGVNMHTASRWCVRSEFSYGKVKDPLKLCRGKDCISKFCEHIIAEACRLYSSFPELPMEPLTKAQSKEYSKAKNCHICFTAFKPNDQKVRDHCHYTGCYRGAAHSLCNLQYKIPSYIPAVFHDLAGYDAHMFI